MHAHYFHKDIDEYLQHTTLQSMTTYVSHYEPVIKACVLTATNSPSQGPNSQSPPIIHQHGGEPSHRKRNRRRTILHSIADAIRTLISNTTHPP